MAASAAQSLPGTPPQYLGPQAPPVGPVASPFPQWHAPTGRSKWIPNRLQTTAALLLALSLLMINDHYFFESVLISDSSMQPTILPNERAILQHMPAAPIHRFDIVVVENLAGAQRIVGLPGDRIRIEQGWKVFINGVSLDYSEQSADNDRTEANDHLIQVTDEENTPPALNFGKTDLQLGPNDYFVLGDNRPNSVDSRSIGPIHAQQIEGHLKFIWYSVDQNTHQIRSNRLFQKLN